MLANCCHSFLTSAGSPPILFLRIFCNVFCQTTSPLFLVAFFISIGIHTIDNQIGKCDPLGTELEYKEPMNRFQGIDSTAYVAWRNRFLGSLNSYKFGLWLFYLYEVTKNLFNKSLHVKKIPCIFYVWICLKGSFFLLLYTILKGGEMTRKLPGFRDDSGKLCKNFCTIDPPPPSPNDVRSCLLMMGAESNGAW